ncbi:hypothetical protein MKW94_003780 [Papaver nudicaule]|uniref:Uncharacterized protein n=1 Tax=Papaver nudicaule TaxID=74823 RepID=A0AA41VVE3_PAPNU|nr:hypothetical protein [Papaver nudicaule]
MAKFCSAYVVLLLLLVVFAVDNVPMKVESVRYKYCRVAWQGCKNDDECDIECLKRYGGRGTCFKPPGTFFIECSCEYQC